MKEVKLGQVCKIRNGFAFKSSEFKDDGVPIVRIGEIKNNIVNIEKAPHWKIRLKWFFFIFGEIPKH